METILTKADVPNRYVTLYVVPDGIKIIEDSTFEECKMLQYIFLPYGLKIIGKNAFRGCSSLTSIIIPDSVTSIGKQAFYNCTGTCYINCNVPSSEAYDSPFYGSLFSSIVIGNNVTSIGDYAFYFCSSLTSITIPNSVTSIGDYAFYFCSSLTSIIIPDSVTEIGEEAFIYYRCNSLTNIYCKPTTPPTLYIGVFYNVPSSCTIYVPSASVDAYKSAEGWSNYAAWIVGYDF